MVEFIDWLSELDTKPVASILNQISVNERTITLLAGPSMAGKTAMSLNFSNSAIKNGYDVLFIDTESKPLTSRTEPNLLKILSTGDLENWKAKFNYVNISTLDKKIFPIIKQSGAKLVIIDSLYNAFCRQGQNPKSRAKEIKYFIIDLKSFVYENKIAAIITSPVGTSGENKEKILGGDAIKQFSDQKLNIQFKIQSSEITGTRLNGLQRIVVADAIRNYKFEFSDGGVIDG